MKPADRDSPASRSEDRSFETAHRHEVGVGAILASIIANTLLAVVKIASGVMGHAYVLIADGIESAVDIFSSTIIWGGLKIGAKPPDENHPFGHGKAESLAALVVSVALLSAAAGIAIQSVHEILSPQHMPAKFTLVVLIIVVAVKEVLFRFLSGVGNTLNSLSLKVDAWHHRSDALTSLAAFVGISIALVAGDAYASADDWAALLACGIIAYNGVRLFRLAIAEIMDAAAPPETERQIRSLATAVEGAQRIEKCRIRKSGLGFHVEIHVEVDGEVSVHRGHEIAHEVKDALVKSALGVSDAIVHIEPAGVVNPDE